MSEDAVAGYIERWRQANPQCGVAWTFLRPPERTRFGALAALQHEWLRVVREIREPEVAAVKLAWWREEMQAAAGGDPRHPLTQALFPDDRIRAIPPAVWIAAVDAARLGVDAAPAADFAAQRADAAPLGRAFATLENHVWFGPGEPGGQAAEGIAIGHLIGDLRALVARVADGRSPLPMRLLARHGLTVDALAADGAARRAALHDYAGQLARALAEASALDGRLTLFRATQVQHDLVSLRKAERAAEPLRALRGTHDGVGGVLKTWRAARTWRRQSFGGSFDATA